MPGTPLAILTLLPSQLAPDHPYAHPTERRVNRAALLDVAPDRESLLCSNKSIEELRHLLKVQVRLSTGHWLYRNHHNTLNTSMLSTATRTSTIIKGTTGDTDDSKLPNSGLNHVVRRVSSVSSISPLSQSHPMFSFKNGFFIAPDDGLSLDIWGMPLLSTTDKLISPRPLGPTHILLIHTSSAPYKPNNSRRTTNSIRGLPKVIELPINDLLFLLNVPNLPSHIPVLPRRLHKELPRVVMRVPHLETFPELIVYLHTMNQAELFRALIPESIRDLMHPLPSVTTNFGNIVEQRQHTSCKPRQLLGMFACCFSSDSSNHEVLPNASPPERGRSINDISKEISEVTASTADGSGLDPVLHAVCLLDALRDNLDYIGYFGKSLWNELDICREILVRAISWRAKVNDYDQKE